MPSREYRIGTGLVRGISRRCPLCGSGKLFRNWLQSREVCPRCGIRLDRGESDFFLGGFTMNFIAVELLLAGFLATMVIVTWPEVPWSLLQWVGIPLVAVAPVVFYPFSRTLWLALDLMLRPPRPEDFADHDEGEGASDRDGYRVS